MVIASIFTSIAIINGAKYLLFYGKTPTVYPSCCKLIARKDQKAYCIS
jgi:hypothetical protein